MEMKQGKILQENVQLAVKAKQLIGKKKICRNEKEVCMRDFFRNSINYFRNC